MNPKFAPDNRLASAPIWQDDPPEADPAVSALTEHRSPTEGLLDEVLQSTAKIRSDAGRSPLDQFLEEPSPWKALCLWFGLNECSTPLPTKPEITRRLSRVIARIDMLLSRQVNAILHHPAFQKLEASWRGPALPCREGAGRRFRQDPDPERLLERAGPGPDARPRVRPEPVVSKGVRGGVRSSGGRTLRRPAGRLRDPAPHRRRPSL